MIELNGIIRDYSLPVEQIKASQVGVFTKFLKNKLLAKDSAIAELLKFIG